MGHFEYVMVLVSIVVGLAITHLLTALAAAIHRIRGHGEPIQLDTVYVLWIIHVLIWLLSFWWWEFKFQELQVEWTFGLYLFIVAYAIGLFMLAAILVPTQMQGVRNSFDYFMAGRKWFFGAQLALLAVDLADSFLKGWDWGTSSGTLITVSVLSAACVIGLMGERRSLQLLAVVGALSANLINQFAVMGVLGLW